MLLATFLKTPLHLCEKQNLQSTFKEIITKQILPEEAVCFPNIFFRRHQTSNILTVSRVTQFRSLVWPTGNTVRCLLGENMFGLWSNRVHHKRYMYGFPDWTIIKRFKRGFSLLELFCLQQPVGPTFVMVVFTSLEALENVYPIVGQSSNSRKLVSQQDWPALTTCAFNSSTWSPLLSFSNSFRTSNDRKLKNVTCFFIA